MKNKGLAKRTRLAQAINASQFFSLAFGCIIGVAWVVVLGDLLRLAGPLGTMLGFVGAGLVSMLIGLCYAEIITIFPASGGEVVYAYEIYGLKTCFATGWCLALAYVALTAFEGISIGWVASTLFPGLQGVPLYTVHGTVIDSGTLVMGLGGMALLVYLNYRGAQLAAGFQESVTYLKIVIAVICVSVGILFGRAGNLHPLFLRSDTGSIWGGVLSVFLTGAFWYAGFNIISAAAEEKARATSLRTVGRMIVLSIALAMAFYCLVILACCMLYPWKQLTLLNLGVATVFQVSLGSALLTKMVLTAALLGNITAWNAFVIGASRVLFALGRARIAGTSLGEVHPVFGSPAKATLLVGAVASAGVLLGRGLILPIVNVTSSCFAFVFLLICMGVVKRRLKAPLLKAPYRAPGGMVTACLGCLGSLFMLVVSLYQPHAATGTGAIPAEWAILAAWSLLGLLFWFAGRGIRRGISEGERRRLILGDGAVKAAHE
ncbi:MAG TPA: APC family permease [Bryobacteraceae bacterium]|nr:APC family permease [Bryobacteraceae bacterium]